MIPALLDLINPEQAYWLRHARYPIGYIKYGNNGLDHWKSHLKYLGFYPQVKMLTKGHLTHFYRFQFIDSIKQEPWKSSSSILNLIQDTHIDGPPAVPKHSKRLEWPRKRNREWIWQVIYSLGGGRLWGGRGSKENSVAFCRGHHPGQETGVVSMVIDKPSFSSRPGNLISLKLWSQNHSILCQLRALPLEKCLLF